MQSLPPVNRRALLVKALPQTQIAIAHLNPSTRNEEQLVQLGKVAATLRTIMKKGARASARPRKVTRKSRKLRRLRRALAAELLSRYGRLLARLKKEQTFAPLNTRSKQETEAAVSTTPGRRRTRTSSEMLSRRRYAAQRNYVKCLAQRSLRCTSVAAGQVSRALRRNRGVARALSRTKFNRRVAATAYTLRAQPRSAGGLKKQRAVDASPFKLLNLGRGSKFATRSIQRKHSIYGKGANLLLTLRHTHLKKLRALPKVKRKVSRRAKSRRTYAKNVFKNQLRIIRKQPQKRRTLTKQVQLTIAFRTQLRARILRTPELKKQFQVRKIALRSLRRRFARLLKLAHRAHFLDHQNI